MRKGEKSKSQLLKELQELRSRLAEIETATARSYKTPELAETASRESCLGEPCGKQVEHICPTCDAFLQSVEAIFEFQDLKDQARSILRRCNQLIGAAAGFAGSLNDEGTRGEALCVETGESDFAIDPPFRTPVRLAGILQSGEVVIENHFQTSKWQSILPEGHTKIDNILLAPLAIKGKILGFLYFVNKPGGFTQGDAKTISAFSNLMAIAFHNSRAIESLKNSEERFRSVAQSASDAVLCFDSNGRIIFWNPAAETIFGYSSTEILGKRLNTLVPKRYRSTYARRMNQLILNEKTSLVGKTLEMVGLRKDGSEFPAEVSFSAWEAQGKVFFTNIVRDITQRKQAEEAVRRSEDMYRTIFENTGTAVAIIEEDTTISMINAEFAKLYGCSRDQIESKKSWTELVFEEDLEKMKKYHCLRRMKPEAAPRSYEFRFVNKRGDVRKALLTIAMIPGTNKSIASILDITVFQKTEEALRKQQQLFQTILEVTPDLLVLKDQDLVYRAANPAFCRFIGKPAEEIIGKTAYDFFPPNEAEKYRNDDIEVMAAKQTQVEEEEVTGAEGKKWFYVARTPVFDHQGEPAGVLCSMRDITELKQVEEALREKEHFLASVFASIQDGICVLDNDLNVIRVNPTLERWYESSMPLVGKKCYEAFHRRNKPCKNCPTARSFRTGKAAYKVAPKIGPKGEIIGWFDLYCFPFVDQTTGQIKGMIEYVHDATRRKKAQEQLRQSFHKLQTTIEATIQAMAEVVEIRDTYTAKHQRRVAKLACAIAEELGLPKKKAKGIEMAAIVHDIGKIGTPIEILNKPARLTDLEFSLIKNHPQAGCNVLKAIEFPWPIAEIVLQHHERLNSSGYPFGLSGESICPEAKILAVADVVEAMASHRPYRPALGIQKALDEISKHKGTLYDPDVVDACVRLFLKKGFSLD